jgi:hypothetical protein
MTFASYAVSANMRTNTPPLQQISQTNLHDQLQPISASDSVDKGFTLDGSFLYWNAKTEGLEFAERVKITGINGTPTLIKSTGDAMSPAFTTWDPGFQIGLGYIFSSREQWHTRLSWTRFDTNSHKSVETNINDLPNKYMIPIWVSVLTGPAADKASGHWDLDFDTLDLELNRPFFIGKWLSLDPKIGMRGAWIDQHYNVKYHALFPTSTTILIRNTSFRSNESFKGVGIKMGSDLKFYLCKSLSILGNLSTSILWGKLTLHEKIKGYIVIDPTTTLPEIVKFNKSRDVLRANLEGQLGCEWQMFYSKDKLRFGISALYSFAYWFKQNTAMTEVIPFNQTVNLPSVTVIPNNGDLQIQGLNIKIDFDF